MTGTLGMAVDTLFAFTAYPSLLVRSLESRNLKLFFLSLFVFPLAAPILGLVHASHFYSKMWEYPLELKEENKEKS